jgi:hypothetical protein
LRNTSICSRRIDGLDKTSKDSRGAGSVRQATQQLEVTSREI